MDLIQSIQQAKRKSIRMIDIKLMKYNRIEVFFSLKDKMIFFYSIEQF